jgi:putative ABC transport system permease protein
MAIVYLQLLRSGLRRRRVQTGLSFLVIATAAASLAIATSVDSVADRPWQRTFDGMRGAHVTVFSQPGDASLSTLGIGSGVVATTGPVPFLITRFTWHGRHYGLNLSVSRSPAATVERPLYVGGSRPSREELALERSFADRLGIRVGDRVRLENGTRLRVAGIAVLTRSRAYPESQPGLGVAPLSVLTLAQSDRSRWAAWLGVRLADPAHTDGFARGVFETAGASVHLTTWRSERADALDDARTASTILAIFAVLIVLTAGFVLATLVGGRVVAQARETGLLKAVGLAPRQVVIAGLVEQLLVALPAGLAGIGLGLVATPFFVPDSASLLQASEVPALSPARLGAALAVVLLTVAAFVALPSWRAARVPSAQLLHPSRRGTARLAGAWSLPLPIAVGIRDAVRRPGRSALAVLALALAVSSVTATLAMEATLALPATGGMAALDPVSTAAAEAARLRPIVYGLDAVLLVVGGINLVASIVLGLRERIRELGLLKAVGLTPAQIAASFVSTQGLFSIGAVVVGVPLGLALFRVGVEASGGGELAYPAWWSLVILALCSLVVVALLAAPLSRGASRLSVTDALRYE